MSKLAQSIQAIQTGERHYKKTPILTHLNVSEKFEELNVVGLTYGYKVEAKVGVYFKSSGKDDPSFNRALSNARALIINQVFGEFRDPLCLLREALYDQDIKKAQIIAERLCKQMFEDGV